MSSRGKKKKTQRYTKLMNMLQIEENIKAKAHEGIDMGDPCKYLEDTDNIIECRCNYKYCDLHKGYCVIRD